MPTKIVSFSQPLTQEVFDKRFSGLCRTLQPIVNDILAAPYYLSDDIKERYSSIETLAYALIMTSADFFLTYDDNRKLIGVQVLSDICPGLHAKWHVFAPGFYAHPRTCMKAAAEVLQYAFDREKLALLKLSAEISQCNTNALRLAGVFGAVLIGRQALHCLHEGRLHDNLLLEFYGPDFPIQPVEGEPEKPAAAPEEVEIDGEEWLTTSTRDEPSGRPEPVSERSVESELPPGDAYDTLIRQQRNRASKHLTVWGQFQR